VGSIPASRTNVFQMAQKRFWAIFFFPSRSPYFHSDTSVAVQTVMPRVVARPALPASVEISIDQIPALNN
jgi:hypothetical protein